MNLGPRRPAAGSYFDERRTILFGAQVKLKKHRLFSRFRTLWVDMVLVEAAGQHENDILLLPHAASDQSSSPCPHKSISLNAVQYAFRERKYQMTAVYPNSVRYTFEFKNNHELACWKAELLQAQQITSDDYSEIMFHVMTTDDNPIHALLKTSRMNSTALVAVDPISFEELQMWILPTLISVTVNYETGVGVVFSYICPQTNTQVEDEVKLFSLSPAVISELKPFLDSFLKLRLGDLYLGIKIEKKEFGPSCSASTETARVSECAEIKYIFQSGSNGVQVQRPKNQQTPSAMYHEVHGHGTFPRRQQSPSIRYQEAQEHGAISKQPHISDAVYQEAHERDSVQRRLPSPRIRYLEPERAFEHDTFPRRQRAASPSSKLQSSFDNTDIAKSENLSLSQHPLPGDYTPFIASLPKTKTPVKLPPNNLLRPGVASSR